MFELVGIDWIIFDLVGGKIECDDVGELIGFMCEVVVI